jgi:hypothetical protein
MPQNANQMPQTVSPMPHNAKSMPQTFKSNAPTTNPIHCTPKSIRACTVQLQPRAVLLDNVKIVIVKITIFIILLPQPSTLTACEGPPKGQ